ncbi:signal recognition particle subunit SRP54 [Lipingzhangella halophila]|uniref:Signal recognition particle protein n=1 Tax=Lipingzhangella halophila TaxID=1783352 RepID=A0A7W7W568_9ACTN|nr:signal recognition particle protein [Lipingzhangella halophila]MBB4933554.1 signal recognition particle subunit SRP54 [Lipingzhangella halophila]
MFETLSDRLTSVFTSLRGKGRLSEEDINSTAREIRLALLEADVALPVVRDFIARVKERARGDEVANTRNPAQQVINIINEELVQILGGETREIRFATKTPPTVIMLAGLQGTGKTTLAGKLGKWLAGERNTPVLVAADLQRPNAVTQLQVVGERANVPVFAPQPGNGVGDPVEVARESIEHARHNNHNVVIIDTAGRLGVDSEMMQQAADIRDAVEPDEILFVVDAMVGQDAVNTAQAFLDGVGYDAVALTKLDGDARGGAALSIRHITGRPIMFASTGEKLEDFDLFHPDRMASRILDMGDMQTLMDKAQKTFEGSEVEQMASTLASEDDFTLDDFLQQMSMVRRLGPISNLLSMMPGMGQMKDQIGEVDDKDLDRITAVIQSMTPSERANPKIINGSRRLRIANGSGTQVSDVNGLVTRFFEAQKMMRQMKNGGMPGMPGMPGTPGQGGGKKKAKPQGKKAKKAKQRSGNPLKAKQQEAEKAAERQRRREQGGEQGGEQTQQLPPGLGGGSGGPQLPPGLGGNAMPDLSDFKLDEK